MNKIFLVLVVILLSGCVATKEGEPIFKPEPIPKCTELIKSTADNLKQLGVDQTKVQSWEDNVVSMEVQPCADCQRLNEAVNILKDENGEYKDAMIKLIQAVEKYDPNSAKLTSKQTKELSNTLMESNDTERYSLAGQYTKAIEVLQIFLIADINLTPAETKNFILDKFYIPLIKQQEEQAQ